MGERSPKFFTRHGILGFVFGLAFATSIVMLAMTGAIYAISLVSSLDALPTVRDHWPIILVCSVAAAVVLIFRNRFFEGE